MIQGDPTEIQGDQKKLKFFFPSNLACDISNETYFLPGCQKNMLGLDTG